MVFVDAHWKDLEETIKWLRENDGVAKGIARRQRESFVESGLLSEAAEVCYWRGLISGWKSVAGLRDEKWRDESAEGMRWETFALTDSVRWE